MAMKKNGLIKKGSWEANIYNTHIALYLKT